MKNRMLALAAIAAASVVVALALVKSWPRGPTWEGKSAAQWFRLYCSESLPEEQEDARDAFEAVGNQAVPFLLSVLAQPDRPSLVSRSYMNLRSKLPLPVRRVLPRVSTENSKGRAAQELLGAIRPPAKDLMPWLHPWLSSPEQPRHLLALKLLGCLSDGGSQGVSFLIQALQSTNRATRSIAVESLARLGPEARTAVPALVAVLDDPATRPRAIRALGYIGPAAKEAVPRLEQLLDTSERCRAAAAIHKINPQGNGLRLLIEAAGNPQSRLAAIYWIGEIGPAAMPALDTLLEALRTETGTDRHGGPEWFSVADAMHKISPTNRAVIPILLEKLRDAEERTRLHLRPPSGSVSASVPPGPQAAIDRLNTAAWLVRFDAGEPHGLEVLAETLRSDPEAFVRASAAYLLRQAGPGARAAIPALEAALNDRHETVRRAAASALRKVAPHTAQGKGP